MIRLHAVVEGQTEETFVRDVLAVELGAKNIFMDAHRVTTGRRKGQKFRGGISSYQQLNNDLTLWMRQDRGKDARFTSMVDLYRLPKDFPGFAACQTEKDVLKRVMCLEKHFKKNIADSRFVPYIQLHEFEALLFSDVQQFRSAFPGKVSIIHQLALIRRQFESPEHINDRPDQAPSTRILKLIPEYVKPVFGVLIAQHIGFPVLRANCAHFNEWIQRLEQIGS